MFQKVKLDNGVTIVIEKMPTMRSISIGIWVGTGSRNEIAKDNGISHFIEHLMFKGTKTRSAEEIAKVIDNIGGQINAFTGKESTCYYTKTLDEHFEKAIELLSDMYFNSSFSDDSINVEKGVISEEIGMYQDTLDELVQDLLSQTVWGDNPLGFPILGTLESLNGIDRNMILDYYHRQYNPSNTVIAVAGNFDQDKIIEVIKKYFGQWKHQISEKYEYANPDFISDVSIIQKDSEQTHISLALNGIPYGEDEMYSLLAANNVFGGSMSSRLFQNIREKRGLVYTIYGFPSSYKNCGLFNIYAGFNPQNISELLKLIVEEINYLVKNKLTNDEIFNAKEQLKGNYILGLEGTSSRMTSIGKTEVLLGKIFSPDEILEKINRVNVESVNNIIEKVFNTKNVCLSLVGKVNKDIDYKEILKLNQ